MKNELHEIYLHDLRDRNLWEQRQKIWYSMRHDGLRRKTKPWPGAADMHFPLADSMIEKLKPFYVQVALYSSEFIATFISLLENQDDDTSAIGEWFDYKLKQKTNLERQLLTTIDHMLMAGKAPMKIYWDPDKKRVCFDAKDPIYFVVPKYTDELQDADHVVEVKHYSKAAYLKLSDNYNKDPDFIKRIVGRSNAEGFPGENKLQEKDRREGLTTTQNENQIILCEGYTKDSDGNVKLSWWSPLFPDEPARVDQGLPYDHQFYPYVDFATEVKDKGYYSPRGVPEIVAAFEASLNKMLNEKHDFMTLKNRPIYSSDGTVANAQNIRLTPGSISPVPLREVSSSGPAVSWDQEMVSMRMVAEYRVGMPDFGIGQQLNTDQRRTATEVDKLSSLMSQNVDLRARIFRQSFGQMLQQAWSLYVQYDNQDLNYWVGSEMRKISQDSLKGKYSIRPNGSADNASRQVVFGKAQARFQLLRGDPYILQGPLRRDLLSADDPRLVKLLYAEPADQNAGQAEEQASEINDMLIGFPVQISPQDDDFIHLETLIQFIDRKIQLIQMHAAGQALPDPHPVMPDIAPLLLQHGGAHFARLQQNKQAHQMVVQIKPMMDRAIGFLSGIIQSAANQAQQIPQGAPSNVAQLSQGVPPMGAAPMPPPAQAAAAGPMPAGPAPDLGGAR